MAREPSKFAGGLGALGPWKITRCQQSHLWRELLLHTRLCTKPFIHPLTYHSYSAVMPIVQMRKLRCKEVQ